MDVEHLAPVEGQGTLAHHVACDKGGARAGQQFVDEGLHGRVHMPIVPRASIVWTERTERKDQPSAGPASATNDHSPYECLLTPARRGKVPVDTGALQVRRLSSAPFGTTQCGRRGRRGGSSRGVVWPGAR